MISSYAELLLIEYIGRPMLLDSNLLLLLIVGSFDSGLVRSFKRLSIFSQMDLSLLQNLSVSFPIATCPHVLTEVSNLANALPEPLKRTVFAYMASTFESLEEVHVSAREIVRLPGFEIFGLTDVALSELCQENLLITHDERFAAYLRGNAVSVLTLKDLRATRNDLFRALYDRHED
jgi:hypothetical protein